MVGTTAGGCARTETWRAGDIELDVGRQRVLRAGVAVELPRLSFELLLALMRAAPNFLSNEELMSRVWPGLVVSPETVTQRVKLLRDALGDDPRQPSCIEGLRGRGYRIMAPVTVLEPPGSVDQSTAPRSRRVWWAAGATALIIIAALWLLLSQGFRPAAESAGPQVRTVAILPFEVLNGSDQGQVLATGLVDSVLAQLSDAGGLEIISSYSASRIDAQLGPQEIGRRLGARYLVLGSVQESGGKLRVTAKLVDSRSGRVPWTRKFDHSAADFFGMQDAVATGVMQALQARISGLDPTIPAPARSHNVDAQLAYLRGRALLGRTTVAGSMAAEREFTRARELDPSFVPAITGLYDSRMQAASLRRSDMAAAIAANSPLLADANALQPDSGAAQLARAMWGRDSAATRVVLFETGLRQDPANVRAITAYSELLDSMDRMEEARVWLERALRIDPLWPRAHFRAAQRNFNSVGAAIEMQTQKVLELDPNYYPALQRQAKYLWQQHGKVANAISIIEHAMAADPENPWAPHTAVAFYLDVNDPLSAAGVARSNPVVAASTAALRAQYNGDWRQAGEAARAAGSRVFGQAERWGVPTALRDHALRTGQEAPVIAELARQYTLSLDAPWQLTAFNFREAGLIAHLLLASGERRQGLARLDEVIQWIDANGYMGPIYNLRAKAQALALKGESDAALALLAESFRQNDYTHWWYTLQFDPTWDGLRTDPQFVAIAASVRSHVASEVQKLAALRREGQVPARDSGLSITAITP